MYEDWVTPKVRRVKGRVLGHRRHRVEDVGGILQQRTHRRRIFRRTEMRHELFQCAVAPRVRPALAYGPNGHSAAAARRQNLQLLWRQPVIRLLQSTAQSLPRSSACKRPRPAPRRSHTIARTKKSPQHFGRVGQHCPLFNPQFRRPTGRPTSPELLA